MHVNKKRTKILSIMYSWGVWKSPQQDNGVATSREGAGAEARDVGPGSVTAFV